VAEHFDEARLIKSLESVINSKDQMLYLFRAAKSWIKSAKYEKQTIQIIRSLFNLQEGSFSREGYDEMAKVIATQMLNAKNSNAIFHGQLTSAWYIKREKEGVSFNLNFEDLFFSSESGFKDRYDYSINSGNWEEKLKDSGYVTTSSWSLFG
jgi:hypothetical protein